MQILLSHSFCSLKVPKKENTTSLNAQILPLALSTPELLTDGGCDYYGNV